MLRLEQVLINCIRRPVSNFCEAAELVGLPSPGLCRLQGRICSTLSMAELLFVVKTHMFSKSDLLGFGGTRKVCFRYKVEYS